jgi:hypothetical protein
VLGSGSSGISESAAAVHLRRWQTIFQSTVARLAKVAAKKFLASFRGFARHAKSFVVDGSRRGGSADEKRETGGGGGDRLDAMIVNLKRA